MSHKFIWLEWVVPVRLSILNDASTDSTRKLVLGSGMPRKQTLTELTP